jgi:hypothetical protein
LRRAGYDHQVARIRALKSLQAFVSLFSAPAPGSARAIIPYAAARPLPQRTAPQRRSAGSAISSAAWTNESEGPSAARLGPIAGRRQMWHDRVTANAAINPDREQPQLGEPENPITALPQTRHRGQYAQPQRARNRLTATSDATPWHW